MLLSTLLAHLTTSKPLSGPDGHPANSLWPVCLMLLRRPCTGSGARMTAPPAAAASAWWPRHTPRTGVLVQVRRMSRHTPAERCSKGGNWMNATCGDCFCTLQQSVDFAGYDERIHILLAQQYRQEDFLASYLPQASWVANAGNADDCMPTNICWCVR